MSQLPCAINFVPMESIIKALSWREATKQFDKEKKLTQEQLHTILEAARLSPSSYGLQPWSFVVVSDPALRARLSEASWNQPQITDASHLIVFTAKMPGDALVDAYISDIAATRGVDAESFAGFAQTMKGTIANMDEAARLAWAQKQVYLALGVVITTAATLGIDACPMEGFDAQKYNEILGLTERGLHATVALPVGFRLAERGMQKVRFPEEQIVIEM